MAQKKKVIERNFKGLRGSHIVWKRVKRKGRGVFTTRRIKKGDIVEVAPAIPMSKKHVRDDEPPDGWVLEWDEETKGQEYAIVLGYIMLYNHSGKPNIELESDLEKETVTAVALRDIKPGEELIWDYGCDIWFEAAE